MKIINKNITFNKHNLTERLVGHLTTLPSRNQGHDLDT